MCSIDFCIQMLFFLPDNNVLYSDFVAMVTYMTWCSIVVTTATCISMMYESPNKRVMDHAELVIAEYIFVIFMGSEMILKVYIA